MDCVIKVVDTREIDETTFVNQRCPLKVLNRINKHCPMLKDNISLLVSMLISGDK